MSLFKLELGPNPAGEDCIQVVAGEDRTPQMIEESNRYIAQLKFENPDWVEKCVWFKVVKHQHEFGTYVEVEIRCNETDEAATEYCFEIENKLPEKWHDNFRTPEAYERYKESLPSELHAVL